VELIDEFRRQSPDKFAWREPPYEYEHDKQPIDILFGSDQLRKTIDAGGDIASFVASWKADEESFKQLRQKYLLY
jgi:uncharacterized protein YbbC (DUF1343 family)